MFPFILLGKKGHGPAHKKEKKKKKNANSISSLVDFFRGNPKSREQMDEIPQWSESLCIYGDLTAPFVWKCSDCIAWF